MYQYSGQHKEGFHPASREETLGVINQACGTSLHIKDIEKLVDEPRSYSSLNKDARKPFLQLMSDLYNTPMKLGTYGISHADGYMLAQVHDRGVILRYTSDEVPANVFVVEVPDVVEKPSLIIPRAFYDSFITKLTSEQKTALEKDLQDYDLVIV